MQRRYRPFLASGDASLIPADLEYIIFQMAVRHGGEKEYERMLEIHGNLPDPMIKIKAPQALGSATQKHLILQTLEMIPKGSIVDQDVR